MHAPAPAAKSYDLHFLVDGKTFFWKNPNRGVTLTDAGLQSSLSWNAESGSDSRVWTDIVSVTMMSASDGKAEVNQCHIQFRDGRKITVSDAGPDGTVDHGRTPAYRGFIRDLHARLAKAPAGTIRFSAGVPEGRHLWLQVTLAIAALLFVALPFVLLFIVGDWRVLFTLAAGAAFVWPFWRIMEKNKPRSYDPRHPPGELME